MPLQFRSTTPAALRDLILTGFCLVSIAGLTACTTKDNPDEIRQRTAEATATMKRDAKAVAEGVKEGMSRDKTFDINKASRQDLLTLPGITERQADRIIVSSEPYAFRTRDAEELAIRYERPAHLIDGEWTSWYGSRAIEGLKALARFRRTLR